MWIGRLSQFVCLTAIFFIIGTGSEALADQIVLKNGDRLTGVIVKADGSSLVMKTEFAGDVTVKADAIDQITSDQQLYLTLSDGRTVVGTVAARSGQVEVSPKDGPRVAVARETRRDKTTLYAAIIKSKNKTDGVSVTTANAIRGGGRYEIALTSRLSTFNFADFEYNEIQLLDLRSVIGGGLGFDVIKSDRARLQLFGGGSWNHEDFSTGLTRNSGEAIAGQDLTLRLNDRVSLKERLQFFPNLTNTGEYRVTFDAGISTKLTSFLDWQLTVSDRYLSNPVGGAKKNDLLLTTGLRVIFRR